MRARILLLALLFAACARREPAPPPPAMPAEESYIFEDTDGGRIVVGLLLPTREPVILASGITSEKLRQIAAEASDQPREPEVLVEEPEPDWPRQPAPWGDQGSALVRKTVGHRQIVLREITAEEIRGIPVVLVANRERSAYESGALQAYVAAGGIIGSLKKVEGASGADVFLRLAARAIETSPFVRRYKTDPLAVVEARRDGDVVEVRLAGRAGAAALRDTEGRTLWTPPGDPPNPLRFPCPDPANDPYACRLDLTHDGLRRSYRIVDLVGTTERRLLAGNCLLAGGTFAARVLFANTKTGAPVAGIEERFSVERGDGVLASAYARSDALGAAETRLAIPEYLMPGPAQLVVGKDRFPVTISREVRLSVVTDRGIYKPDDTVHVRVLGHRFPSGRPAGGEPVTLRHSKSRGSGGERKIVLSENGIGSSSIALEGAAVGTHAITAVAEGAEASIIFDVRAFEPPRFTLALDPPEIALRPGEAVPVTLRARYVDQSPLAGGSVRVYGRADPQEGTTDAEGVFRFTVRADESDSVQVRLRDADGRTRDAFLRVSVLGVPEISVEPLGDLVAGMPCAFRIAAPGVSSATLAVDGGEERPVALDALGAAVVEATPSKEVIALRVTAGGAKFGREMRAFVPREGQPVVRPSRRDATVGETLSVDVHGPRGPLHLDLSRDGTLVRALTGTGPLARFEIDLDEHVSGMLTLHAYGEQPGTRAQVLVRRGRTLDVEARPDRDAYRPRETARVDVAVRDRDGSPAPAALGYWAVDRAVLALRRWPSGLETVFDALPGKPGQLAAVAEAGGPALALALGPIEHDGEHRHRIWHRQGPEREEAAQARAQAVFSSHLARLRAAYLAIWKDIPLTEVRAFANIRQQIRWLVETGRLDPALLVDPWGEPIATWQQIPWGQLTWTSSVPGGTGAVTGTWDLEQLWYETPDRIVRLYDAACETIGEEGCFDAPFTGPSTNAAIGLGGGAGGGRRGRGGKRNLKAGGGSGIVVEQVTLRRDFPPTLVFVPEVLTDEQGRARLEISLADSITTWDMRLVASDACGATGVGHASLRVTQPLSVEPWVASHLTVGDLIDVPVALRNGTEGEVTVAVRFESSPELGIEGASGAEVAVPAGGTGAYTFRIRAKSPGRATVRVLAEAGQERDAVERAIAVRPFAREVTDAVSFPLREGVATPLLSRRERGALRLDLYPGPVAETVAGLEALVKEPHGCFEQTSSTVYPMALAVSYLRRTRQSAPELEDRAAGHLAKGYNALVGYEVKEEPGGFSLFGEAPAGVFLSAYGLMEFTDLREVHPVDPALAPRVVRFLLSRQQEDGSWHDRGDDFALTAYVAWALSVAGERSPEALAWLDARLGDVRDPYRLALAALAFLPSDRARGVALARQAADATGDVESTLVGARGRSSDAETLGLVVQALARADALEGGALIDRLASMRRASGHFGTTQATVQALRALLLAETTASSAAARVEVRDGETVLASREFRPDAAEAVRLDLGDRGLPSIALSGDRRLRATLSRTIWEPWAPSAPRGRVALDVRYPDAPIEVGRPRRAEILITNPTGKRATLVTAEVGLPPGCDAEASHVEGEGALKIERGETAMVFYLPDLEPGARLVFRIPFTPRYRLDVKTAPSKAYEYYTPEEAAVVPPASVRTE